MMIPVSYIPCGSFRRFRRERRTSKRELGIGSHEEAPQALKEAALADIGSPDRCGGRETEVANKSRESNRMTEGCKPVFAPSRFVSIRAIRWPISALRSSESPFLGLRCFLWPNPIRPPVENRYLMWIG